MREEKVEKSFNENIKTNQIFVHTRSQFREKWLKFKPVCVVDLFDQLLRALDRVFSVS